MDLLNRLTTGFFDVALTPFELLGPDLTLVLVSGVVGIVFLVIFKQISWQGGIKGVKDKIKGNMIAIRIYQDDLGIVFKAVFKVFLRNFQYLGLNFGPILPLIIPFVLVLSQLVVRYAYDPIEVVTTEEASEMRSGQGTMVVVELKGEHAAKAKGLSLAFPNGIQPITPLVRSAADGKAFIEVVAVEPVAGEIEVFLDGELAGTKEIVSGTEPTRKMQPERTSSFWHAWLLPAEDTFGPESALASVSFVYPERDLSVLPGGELGILIVVFIASMAFGAAVMKPLKVQI